MPHQTHTSLANIYNIADLQIALDAWTLNPANIIETSINRELEFRAHPLGFISCVIFTEGNRKARLHIWPASKDIRQDEGITIHNHVFNFTSWVLAGEIVNRDVFIDRDGAPRSVYKASYSSENSILVKNDETLNIMNGETCRYSTGMRYSMCAGQLHETRSSGTSVAVTVLITHDLSADRPLVIGPLWGAEKHEYHRRLLSRHELSKVIKDI